MGTKTLLDKIRGLRKESAIWNGGQAKWLIDQDRGFNAGIEAAAQLAEQREEEVQTLIESYASGVLDLAEGRQDTQAALNAIMLARFYFELNGKRIEMEDGEK